MANIISIIIALLTLPLFFTTVLVSIIPVVGAVAAWITLPFAAFGAVIGAFGEKRVGLILNLIILGFAAFRLGCGGGAI